MFNSSTVRLSRAPGLQGPTSSQVQPGPARSNQNFSLGIWTRAHQNWVYPRSRRREEADFFDHCGTSIRLLTSAATAWPTTSTDLAMAGLGVTSSRDSAPEASRVVLSDYREIAKPQSVYHYDSLQ